MRSLQNNSKRYKEPISGFISAQSFSQQRHTSVVPRSFQFCDPASQELAGHLRLLVWGDRIEEAQFSDFTLKLNLKGVLVSMLQIKWSLQSITKPPAVKVALLIFAQNILPSLVFQLLFLSKTISLTQCIIHGIWNHFMFRTLVIRIRHISEVHQKLSKRTTNGLLMLIKDRKI